MGKLLLLMKKTRAKKFKVRMLCHLQNLFWGVLSGGFLAWGVLSGGLCLGVFCPGVFCPDTFEVEFGSSEASEVNF